MRETREESLRVVLVGQPNAGKTAIFNALTGSRASVGNYPGVTVESRKGHYDYGGAHLEVQDLPGTYSLSSFSPEERVAEDEILNGNPDVVVIVADSNTLLRSLVLMAQMMQLRMNLVLCLNMADESHRAGQKLDIDQMSSLLGFEVLETVGNRGKGIEGLREAIARASAHGAGVDRLVLGKSFDQALDAIEQRVVVASPDSNHRRWIACKVLLGDSRFTSPYANDGRAGREVIDEAIVQRKQIEDETGQDIALFASDKYTAFVRGLLQEVTLSGSRPDARAASDRIDTVLAHRIFGLPLFLLVMYAIFWTTFTLGEYPMSWIESGFESLASWLSGMWPAGSDSALRSLLIDGVIGGVGGVIVFLPNIVLLFLGLALLEDTGYMPRAAHLVDRLMHRFGLHGRSFLPLLTGFGCSIPGIMATRTLENERDRMITMLVLPLMSCGARLPIWMLLIPAFFAPGLRAPMLFLIYMTGIILAMVLALLLRRTVFRGADAPFVMELPPYRLPTLRAIVNKMRERSWLYLRKAGTTILGISIVMWFLASYPKPDSYQVDREVENGLAISAEEIENRRSAEYLQYSAAGHIGRFMEPALRPLGMDWKLGTALVGAFAAKEVFVAQMGIVYSLGGEVDEGTDSLRRAVARDYSPLTGFTLMLLLLIGAPCMATFAIIKRESGHWKWALLQFVGLTGLAYLVSLVVYQTGRLLA